MQRPIVILAGTTLTATTTRLPSTMRVVWATDVGDLRRHAGLQPIVVIDLSAGPDPAALREARAAAPLALVVVGHGEPGTTDVCLANDVALPGALVHTLRYLSGETMRRTPRVYRSGRVVIHHAGGGALATQIVDLSEAGVRIRPLPDDVVGPAALELHVDGVATPIHARGREIRRSRADGDAVLELLDLSPGDRAVLRTATLQPPPRMVAAPRVGERLLVGRSPAFLRAVETLERIAPTDVSVLVLGETGTGKELAARILHDQSRRASGPFVAVNCAALPESLVESELFGHEPGAFTGAVKRRIGRIEQASGGTLFLDEIGDLPAGAQAKLLRALQERVIERLGGGEPIKVDFRLVAATHRDLVADPDHRFRRDLFYRLSVVTVRLPTLRERTSDVPPLVKYFLDLAMQRLDKRAICLSPHAMTRLEHYAWPGNVRELENLCTRLIALSPSGATLGPEHLGLSHEPALVGSPIAAADLRTILDYCEREIIRRTLDRHAGNRTRAAATLGISRQALQQKLARLAAAPTASQPEAA